jgi:hypothetical protein
VTPLILFIVLLMVLGLAAVSWRFVGRETFERTAEPERVSSSVQQMRRRQTTLRIRLSGTLVALILSGLALLLGPQPQALAASASPQIQTTLGTGQYLSTNQYLVSASDLVSSGGHYFTIMQSDGNFCTYKGTGPSDNQGYVWCIRNTALPTGQYFAIMQGDGNFCVYHGTGPGNNLGFVWCAGTNGSGATQAILEADGNFILAPPTVTEQGPPGHGDIGQYTYYCPYPIVWSSFPVIDDVNYCRDQP